MGIKSLLVENYNLLIHDKQRIIEHEKAIIEFKAYQSVMADRLLTAEMYSYTMMKDLLNKKVLLMMDTFTLARTEAIDEWLTENKLGDDQELINTIIYSTLEFREIDGYRFRIGVDKTLIQGGYKLPTSKNPQRDYDRAKAKAEDIAGLCVFPPYINPSPPPTKLEIKALLTSMLHVRKILNEKINKLIEIIDDASTNTDTKKSFERRVPQKKYITNTVNKIRENEKAIAAAINTINVWFSDTITK